MVSHIHQKGSGDWFQAVSSMDWSPSKIFRTSMEKPLSEIQSWRHPARNKIPHQHEPRQTWIPRSGRVCHRHLPWLPWLGGVPGFLGHRATPAESSICLWDVPWYKPSSDLEVPPWLWKAPYLCLRSRCIHIYTYQMMCRFLKSMLEGTDCDFSNRYNDGY